MTEINVLPLKKISNFYVTIGSLFFLIKTIIGFVNESFSGMFEFPEVLFLGDFIMWILFSVLSFTTMKNMENRYELKTPKNKRICYIIFASYLLLMTNAYVMFYLEMFSYATISGVMASHTAFAMALGFCCGFAYEVERTQKK